MHSALKMTPELLSERPIQRVIRKTADYFSGAISERVPPKMADALRNDLYIFSGFRTYHELKESAERLLRPDGSLKPFSEFYQDTLKVRDKYNKAWLKAEYNYAVRTADAAARWAEIEKDKEHIDLLYETVGDSNVRPDHAALEGVCLPVDDPFWAIAYPPNGWNCRCRVLRVAKGSHPYSNSQEATEAFIESTSGKSELFRYNPGKEQRIFSDRHPYYSKRGIRHCAISGDKLAANLDKNEECEVLRNLSQKGKDDRQKWEDRHKEVKKVVDTLCGEDKKRTINQPVLVAPMPTNVIEYCRNKGYTLTETDGRVDIYVSEDRVLHAMRSTKPSRLYAQDFDLLVSTIKKGKVYFDPKHQNIVFATPTKGDKWIKFCIQPRYNVKKHGEYNMLVTGGAIKEINLEDLILIK